MTTIEQTRPTTIRDRVAEIMPFNGWEVSTTAIDALAQETLFRFPTEDDPAPNTGRLLAMSLYGSVLGLTGAGVGMHALAAAFGGAPGWYAPLLGLLGLLSVAAAVASFLSIHRPTLPWVLLLAAAVPLGGAILLATLR